MVRTMKNSPVRWALGGSLGQSLEETGLELAVQATQLRQWHDDKPAVWRQSDEATSVLSWIERLENLAADLAAMEATPSG